MKKDRKTEKKVKDCSAKSRTCCKDSKMKDCK